MGKADPPYPSPLPRNIYLVGWPSIRNERNDVQTHIITNRIQSSENSNSLRVSSKAGQLHVLYVLAISTLIATFAPPLFLPNPATISVANMKLSPIILPGRKADWLLLISLCTTLNNLFVISFDIILYVVFMHNIGLNWDNSDAFVLSYLCW